MNVKSLPLYLWPIALCASVFAAVTWGGKLTVTDPADKMVNSRKPLVEAHKLDHTVFRPHQQRAKADFETSSSTISSPRGTANVAYSIYLKSKSRQTTSL